MSSIHLEIFDIKRAAVFAKLGQFKSLGFLSGGTALALQIKHRKSYDFDIFVSKAITNTFKSKIAKTFGSVKYYVETGDQLSFETEDKIGVTFVRYEFALLRKPIATTSISLAPVVDIAADKAYTIGRRAVWRDYVDIFWLIKESITNISTIASCAEKKFKGQFNEVQFLEQLTYFNDIKIVPVEFISKEYSPGEIKLTLEQAVRTYLRNIKVITK